MTTEDILLAAGEASPDLMEKVAEAIVHLEASDKDGATELLKEIDDIANYAVVKTAGAADIAKAVGRGALSAGKAFGSNAGKGAVIVGGMIGAGLAAAVATDLYDAAKRGITKSTNFKRVMEGNPDLQRSVDKERLRQSFDAIHRYAPEMTADPLVGGAILKSVAELPGNEFTSIKAIIDARKSLQEAKHKGFSPVSLPKSKD